MKKTIVTLFALIGMFSVSFAQSTDDGIKFLYYERMKSAKETLEKVVASKPTDAYAIYWLGQAYIADGDVPGAKAVYQKALQAGVNDPWLWVGMGHITLLENGDVNAARQQFEQAITTSTTKGKKGGENADILNAIGRANADGSSKQGDVQYGIDVLKRALLIDLKNPDIDINLGLLYLKQGIEHGGDAVAAFRDASIRNPQYARAYYRMGRVYQAQNNKESMENEYNKAVGADPAFGPVYLSYFLYYENRDVNKAKEYLDKYVANSDKDCNTEYYVANYLFRAGRYQESLDKAKQMEAGVCKDFARIPVLFAYNYDRLGDSVQAKSYIEKFFATAPAAKIQSDDYGFAGKLIAKFPGSEAAAAAMLRKAIEVDTVLSNKIDFANTGATIFANAKMYDSQLVWLNMVVVFKGKTSESDYYKLSSAAVTAKNCIYADSISKAYVAAFPDKPQGYSFQVSAAKCLDPDSTKGLVVEPMNAYITYLMKDTAANKTKLYSSYNYLLTYYINYAKDYPKALEVADKMMALYTAGEEYDYVVNVKKAVQQAMNRRSGSGGGGGTKPGN